MMEIWLSALIGYLLGSIPFGVLAARQSGRDILREGSGNPGATNALRVLGPFWGVAVLVGDVGKGVLSAYLGAHLAGVEGLAVGACAAALGHAYSIFLRGRGGKIVSVSFGALLFLDWRVAVMAATVFVLVVAVTRYVSLGSMLGAASAFVATLWLPDALAIRLAVAFILALLVWRHRGNIQRLRQGHERKLGERA